MRRDMKGVKEIGADAVEEEGGVSLLLAVELADDGGATFPLVWVPTLAPLFTGHFNGDFLQEFPESTGGYAIAAVPPSACDDWLFPLSLPFNRVRHLKVNIAGTYP